MGFLPSDLPGTVIIIGGGREGSYTAACSAPDSRLVGTNVCRNFFCTIVVATGLRPDTDSALRFRTGARILRMVDALGWSHALSSSESSESVSAICAICAICFICAFFDFFAFWACTTTFPEEWSKDGALHVAAYLAALVTAMPRLGPLPSGMHTIRAARAPGAAS